MQSDGGQPAIVGPLQWIAPSSLCPIKPNRPEHTMNQFLCLSLALTLGLALPAQDPKKPAAKKVAPAKVSPVKKAPAKTAEKGFINEIKDAPGAATKK